MLILGGTQIFFKHTVNPPLISTNDLGGTGGAGGKGGQYGGAGGKGGAPDLRFLNLAGYRDLPVSEITDLQRRFIQTEGPRLFDHDLLATVPTIEHRVGGRGGAGGAGELRGGAGGVGEGVSLPDLPPELLSSIFGHIEEGTGGMGGASPILPGTGGQGQATQYASMMPGIPAYLLATTNTPDDAETDAAVPMSTIDLGLPANVDDSPAEADAPVETVSPQSGTVTQPNFDGLEGDSSL
ncbi:hypothetical protein R3P38DRAFT_3291876 [Favolaschia claudopus]|uniref:Uncharacterized protein n=1 Tax=Favolaschia claudopus TaxID=2862362 RepID=A0AAV9ZM63_9AGAR